jgi:hypothetical protein
MMQAAFIVINEDRSGDVHGVRQQQSILNPAFTQAFLDLRGYVDKTASSWN